MPDPYPQYQLRSEKDLANGYAGLDSGTKIPLILLPALDHGALTGLSDNDHPQYQLKSERGMSDGYAPLDTIGVVPKVHLPTDIIYGADLATHEAAADPHPVYQKESEKGAANGYASLDASGLVPGSQLPANYWGWSIFQTGTLTDADTTLWTVPTGKAAKVSFFCVKNSDAHTLDIDITIYKVASGSSSVGTVTLEPSDYVYYVDPSEEYWTLADGDYINGIASRSGEATFILMGSLVDA